MQFAGVDHVETLIADGLEAGHDLSVKWIHAPVATPVAGKIQIHVPANKAVGHARKARQRILDATAKNLFAEHVVIDGHADRELGVRARAAIPELEIVFPASEEELPLQVSHLNQLRAVL